jgi:hypothetical protein
MAMKRAHAQWEKRRKPAAKLFTQGNSAPAWFFRAQ